MKNKQKIGIIAMLTALLAVLVAFTSCLPDSEAPAPISGNGYGYALVRIAGLNLRTILPDEDDALDSFESFHLDFTPTGGYAGSIGTYSGVQKYINKSDLDTPIALLPGIYDFEIIAYTDAYDGTNPPLDNAAIGEEEVEITEGGNNPVTVTMVAYEPSSVLGNGTYSWNIDFTGITPPPSSYDVTMKIELGATSLEIDLKDTTGTVSTSLPSFADEYENTFTSDKAVGEATLVSDYYNVTILLEVTDTIWMANKGLTREEATLEFTEALWVYQNMESHFEHAFTNASFGPQTVTFSYLDDLDGASLTASTTATTSLGGNVTIPTTYSFGTEYTRGTTKYVFAGWWTRDGTELGSGNNPVSDYNQFWGERFTETTSVLGDITVYAWWVESYEFDIVLAALGGNLLELSYTYNGTGADTGTLDKDSTATERRIVIPNNATAASVTITNAGDVSNIKWYWNGAQIGATNDATLNVITSGALQHGFVRGAGFEYLIYITAEDDDNNAPQSYWFILALEP